jgi:hypothetical protein
MRATMNNARKELTREEMIDLYVNRIKENREQETKLKQGKFLRYFFFFK